MELPDQGTAGVKVRRGRRRESGFSLKKAQCEAEPAPSGPNPARKRIFSAKRQAVCLKKQHLSEITVQTSLFFGEAASLVPSALLTVKARWGRDGELGGKGNPSSAGSDPTGGPWAVPVRRRRSLTGIDSRARGSPSPKTDSE